ncbi:AraC-like DNA-binding protein [Neobacillus bataviensis]|uniref:AraC-like DNA-binding protein n=1 Tax=Neobacillus bataviensis TaxID=220685 RepID=A0A561DZ14_9BACI|nr:AraC family transcriptional regulator [Neobacillus bataviensis]TWE08586.1 AraC-like DNA-binding protein [Neobacillus bataviensis]
MKRLKAEYFFENEKFHFFISSYTIKRKEKIEPHTHEFFELVYVFEGKGEHWYEGFVYPIKEGDAFIIEPGKIHGFQVGKDTNLKVFNVLFQLELLKKELQSLVGEDSFLSIFYGEPFLREFAHFNNHLVLEPSEQTEMKIQLQSIAHEYNNKEFGYQLLVKTRMIELFIFLSRCNQKRLNPLFFRQNDHTKAVNQICKFINTHYNVPLSLEQVCKLSGMSKSNFTAKFKQIVGKTFVEYRNDIRIKAAMEFLLNSNDTILSIANKVGFDDVSYFNRTFKEFTKMSPSLYRKEKNKIMLR